MDWLGAVLAPIHSNWTNNIPWVKTKQYTLLLFIALSNVDRFSTFFHRRTLFPGITLLPDVYYRTTCGRSGSKRMGEGRVKKWETLGSVFWDGNMSVIAVCQTMWAFIGEFHTHFGRLGPSSCGLSFLLCCRYMLQNHAVTVGQIVWANAEDPTVCETLLAPPLGMGTLLIPRNMLLQPVLP